MSQNNSSPKLDQSALYKIEVVGRLSENWSDHFGGMSISARVNGNGQVITSISGTVADQPALHGLLRSIRDLGLPLLRVEWVCNL